MWKLSGVTPATERLMISGGSMAVTLPAAPTVSSRTPLTDDATWHQLRGQLDGLAEVFGDDPVLLNSYAVIHGNDPRASLLAEWLTSGLGRTAIADYRIGGRPAFHGLAAGLLWRSAGGAFVPRLRVQRLPSKSL